MSLQNVPGHLIRRAQQLSVAAFMDETGGEDITPVQFAMLNTLADRVDIDQVTLAALVGFDPATSGSVISRLEAKGWIRRQSDPEDRRRKLLAITAEGRRVVQRLQKPVDRVQARILAPLTATEGQQLVRLLAKLVAGHEA